MKLQQLLLQGMCLLRVAAQDRPVVDDSLSSSIVDYDQYSLIIDGKRLFMWSGEYHPWRIPVPELWQDIMQKIKAAGFNTFSMYTHWGWHSAADGKLDFETGAHNIHRIFEMAKDMGLYILLRPGPYINAESSAGGYPGWLLTGAYGSLRNNDTRYTDAWRPYQDYMAQLAGDYSITRGGNVILFQIENEYGEQWLNVAARTPNETAISYMELLEAAAKENGVDMPTIANAPNLGAKSWSLDYDINHVGGDTDLYAVDNYPSCWSCNLADCTSVNGFPPEFTTFDYYTHFQETSPRMPSILGEFQGGSYNPWGGPQGGCVNTTGPDWVNVFYRNNIGQKVAGQNLYMLFGGTNWGGLPYPGVGTSYDYSAPISEARLLGDKYSETKLLSYFVRAAKDLTMVERAGNGTTNFTTNNPQVFAQALRNVDTGSYFYVVKNSNTTLTSYLSFKLTMSTSVGNITVPRYAPHIVLNGRQAKILVSDFNAGSQNIIYSTSEILAVSIQEKKPIIAIWVPTGEPGEFYLKGVRHGKIAQCIGCEDVEFHRASEGLIVSFKQNAGQTVLTFDNGVRVVLVDRSVAYTMWQPMLSNDPHDPLDQTVLVRGPYLVRSATVKDGTVAITGDYNGTTELEVFAPCSRVTFNGRKIVMKDTKHGSLIGTLSTNKHDIASIAASLPALTDWKVHDGLPERMGDYDDSGPAWIAANHSSTQNPTYSPQTYPVLFADDYGFHAQNLLWRGIFDGQGITGIYLSIMTGTSGGWSAWLNGQFLGSNYGNKTLAIVNGTFHLGDNVKSGENVLFIIQDHMGHDQTFGAMNPRGILNATLLGGGNFTSWRLAGNAGGEANIDPIRGPYNEGGLSAERLGWHLPGFDDSSWKSGTPEQGVSTAGANFYRTTFDLDMPLGWDISLGFTLEAPSGSTLRAQLYVNGYMFGKFVPYIGNQISFPVFPGILDYHGENTVGLSLWAQGAEGAKMNVSMSVLGAYESSFSPGVDTEYLRPEWREERLQYA